MLKNFPIGADLTLLNNFYVYPKKDPLTGKWDKGKMIIIYRDNITGKKYNEVIEDPEYDYYISNEKLDYNPLYIKESEARKVTCKFRELDKSIAEETGNEQFYYENMKNGTPRNNRLMHTEIKELFGTTMHIEDFYRQKFDRLYTNETFELSKAYFDIEADVIETKGDFVEPGECPVNAITLILEKQKKFYTFLLRDNKNPQIAQFERNINNKLFEEVKEMVRDKVGGYKKEHRLELDKFEYQFLFYDKEDEINLINDFFNTINYYQPDFALAWNMAFDIPYLIERIKVLGADPAEIICHPEFSVKIVSYFVDELHKNDFEARGDYATICAYTVYMCQMIQFASRRKGQGVFAKFSLDYIGEIMCKVKKLDYSHITNSVTDLCWKNYYIFVLYNIMDTVVQYCIENKEGDIDYTFGKALLNNTRYSKTHRQTIYLVNRAAKNFYNEDRFILCNNHNINRDKPKEKYPGAFVANPLKLKDDIKLSVNGHKIPLVRNLDDYDYKSLYPSIMREFNIAPNTQIGKLIIPYQIFKEENRFGVIHFNRGGKFIEDFQSHNWLEFCHRWFKLAEYSELINDIKEYYTTHHCYGYVQPFSNNGLIKGLEFLDNKFEYVCTFQDMSGRKNMPLRFYDYDEDINKVNEYYRGEGLIS